MSAMKIKQLQYESETWKRLLRFMTDENICLKTRVSEVLKNGFDRRLLVQIEDFNSRFIKEDELIGFLRNQVAELDKLLLQESSGDLESIQKVESQLKKIRGNIRATEKQFGKLKLEFNNYLLANV
ncbi:hypothetical protein [Flavihumibacter fluvii]|uniref:hypothetical protein n=1 Tax=Flavihumibacter fluvii TaxID=2838157 RepID=UPI001BDF0DAC|nr:hypothetical protein [Flavihumibacter fluvii]ULQ53324.1 hypothetical protein KJS93_03210 [Flavihumibacter fluvii]